MDISQNYIEMCEKAEEIQWGHRWGSSGDWVRCHESDKIVVLYYNEHHGEPPEKYTDPLRATWLPRQDQLQEMLDCTLQETLDFVANNLYPLFGTEQFTSMEQLWLAFVMKEKYAKAWRDKEWQVVERNIPSAQRWP